LSEAFQFLPWSGLITIVAPDFFGNPATYNYWGIGDYFNLADLVGWWCYYWRRLGQVDGTNSR